MKKPTNTFYCRKLGCAGYTYNACLTRRQSKMSESGHSLKYPDCAECEQEKANQAKFPNWRFKKPSKRKRPDRVSLRTFKKVRAGKKKVELSPKKSASETEEIGTPCLSQDSTTTFSPSPSVNSTILFSPEIDKLFDLELFIKGQCSYIFSLLREGKDAEAKERIALIKKDLNARGYERQVINNILREVL